MKTFLKNIFSIILLSLPLLGLANDFFWTKNAMVGKVQNVQLQPTDDYPSIAQKYDIGYYELYEANPGVDPDSPVAGTILIIPTQYILPKELDNNIVINLAEMRLYYASSTLHKVFIFPIGIGKEGWNTPIGVFKIANKIKNPSWTAPDDVYRYRIAHGEKIPRVIPPGKNNPLGQYAFRLSNPTYLIHGTDDPVGVGRRSSAGCIRMYGEDIKKLFSMINIGTEVHIINTPYKAAQINDEIYLEAHMPLYEQRVVMHDDVSLATNIVKNITHPKIIPNEFRVLARREQSRAADRTKTYVSSKASSQQSKNSKIEAHNMVDWKKVELVAKNHLGIPQLVSAPLVSIPLVPIFPSSRDLTTEFIHFSVNPFYLSPLTQLKMLGNKQCIIPYVIPH
jgi:L,D-transpeptidase ErfK/SrfK